MLLGLMRLEEPFHEPHGQQGQGVDHPEERFGRDIAHHPGMADARQADQHT